MPHPPAPPEPRASGPRPARRRAIVGHHLFTGQVTGEQTGTQAFQETEWIPAMAKAGVLSPRNAAPALSDTRRAMFHGVQRRILRAEAGRTATAVPAARRDARGASAGAGGEV